MNRSKVWFLFVLTVLPTSLALGQADKATGSKDKVFHFTYDTSSAYQAKMTGEIRRFIWEHWQQKRRGKVRAKFYSIEGEPTTQKLEVFLDGKGRWLLKSEVDERRCSLLHCLFYKPWLFNRKVVVLSEEFDSLERVRPRTRPRPFVGPLPDLENLPGERIEVIPDSEQLTSEEYWLHFKSSSQPKRNWLL